MSDEPDAPAGDRPGLDEQTCVNCGSTQLTQDTDGVWHCGYCRSTFRSSDPAMIVVASPNVQQSDERVVDTGDLLTFDQQQRLSSHLLTLQREHDVVVVVETVNTITENVERYARRRAQELGVGDDAKDNGLYILLVREPRRIQVQAGNGISTHLGPDDIDRVVREQAVPLLKAGDTVGGLIAGSTGLVDEWRANRASGTVRTDARAEADPATARSGWKPRPFLSSRATSGASGSERSSRTSPFAVIWVIVIVVLGIWALTSGGFSGSGGGGGGSGYDGGGGGGYDGGGGGGGGYDGGGGGGGYDGGDFDGGSGGGSDY